MRVGLWAVATLAEKFEMVLMKYFSTGNRRLDPIGLYCNHWKSSFTPASAGLISLHLCLHPKCLLVCAGWLWEEVSPQKWGSRSSPQHRRCHLPSSAVAPLVPERREKPQRDVTIFCCQIKPFSDGECCRGRRDSKLHFERGFAGVCNKSRVTAALYGLFWICSLLCRQPSRLQGLILTSDTKELFTLGSTLFIL